MRPIIGITCPWSEETWGPKETNRGYDYAGRDYQAAIYEAGGLPILIPSIAAEDDLKACAEQFLQTVDGMYFTGGGDRKSNRKVSEIPTLYNQQPVRSRWEDILLKVAYEQDIPCIGVCRGYQMMAVAFGGAMDPIRLPEHKQTVPYSIGIHTVAPSALLAEVVGSEPWLVNSIHVERVEVVPEGFTVAARAEDGSIEAISATHKRFFLGTQFHPELMTQDPRSRVFFQGFLDAARQRQSSR
jgi:putative glutamine amidotransferase